MGSDGSVAYSPLCDVDRVAYLAYIFANCDNGASHVEFATLDGRKGVARYNGGCNDSGGGFVSAVSDVCTAARRGTSVAVASGGSVGDSVGSRNSGSRGQFVSWLAAAGISASVIDNGDDSLRCGGGVDQSSEWRVRDDSHLSDEFVALNPVVDGGKKCGSLGFKGPNYLRNCEWRKKKKERKAKSKDSREYAGSAFALCSDEVRRKLAETRAQRFIRENELAERVAREKSEESFSFGQIRVENKEAAARLRSMKLGHQLALAGSVDLDQLKSRQRVFALRDTELGKVQIERAYSTLSGSGNVPGSAKTMVTDKTISPISSVSQAEIRNVQKEILDVKKFNDQLVAKLNGVRDAVKRSDYSDAVKIVDEDCDAMYAASAGVSLDEDGIPLGAADIGGEGTYYDGYIDDSGRFHFGSKELGNWY